MKFLVIMIFTLCLNSINCMAQENNLDQAVQSANKEINNAPKLMQDTNAHSIFEIKELWFGSIYTSTYRASICIKPSGQLYGVLHLSLTNGNTDIYHIYGQLQNENITAMHPSGHKFSGKFISDKIVAGTINLHNGHQIEVEGNRIQNFNLTDDCVPPPSTNKY